MLPGIGHKEIPLLRSASEMGAVPQLKNVMRFAALFKRAMSVKKAFRPVRRDRMSLPGRGDSPHHSLLPGGFVPRECYTASC